MPVTGEVNGGQKIAAAKERVQLSKQVAFSNHAMNGVDNEKARSVQPGVCILGQA